jgi:hypothetical protein
MKAKRYEQKYIVVNQYGIGGEKGEVAYRPRSTGKKSYDKCCAWVKKNDTVNTMMIVVEFL